MRQEEPLWAIVSTQEQTVLKRQRCSTSTTAKITSIIFFLWDIGVQLKQPLNYFVTTLAHWPSIEFFMLALSTLRWTIIL